MLRFVCRSKLYNRTWCGLKFIRLTFETTKLEYSFPLISEHWVILFFARFFIHHSIFEYQCNFVAKKSVYIAYFIKFQINGISFILYKYLNSFSIVFFLVSVWWRPQIWMMLKIDLPLFYSFECIYFKVFFFFFDLVDWKYRNCVKKIEFDAILLFDWDYGISGRAK